MQVKVEFELRGQIIDVFRCSETIAKERIKAFYEVNEKNGLAWITRPSSMDENAGKYKNLKLSKK